MDIDWDVCRSELLQDDYDQPYPFPFPPDFPDWWDPDEENRSGSLSGKIKKETDPDQTSINGTGYKFFQRCF